MFFLVFSTCPPGVVTSMSRVPGLGPPVRTRSCHNTHFMGPKLKKIWFKLTPRIFYYQITPVLHGVSRPEKVANGRVTTDWLKHPEHRKMFQYCESTRSRSGRRVIVASTRTARYKKSKIPSLAKIVAAQTLVILDISSRLSLYVHYHYHYHYHYCCCCCC